MTAGADINTADRQGLTPLHIAAKHNNPTAAQWLIDKGAAIETLSREGETPAHSAAAGDHAEVIDMLARAGADVGRPNAYGATPEAIGGPAVKAYFRQRAAQAADAQLQSAGATPESPNL